MLPHTPGVARWHAYDAAHPAEDTCLRSLSSGTVGLRSSGTVSTSSLSVTPTASTMHEAVLRLRVGGDGLEVGVVDDADAAALHLLEVGAALDRRA